MTRLSAHIGYLYTELPLADRIAAAARDGFTAVEHPEPFAIPAAEMRQRLDDLGLTFSQVSSGMGDGASGEKGLAALPGREADFRNGFDRALDYALSIGCHYLHPMAGVVKGGWLAAGETYRGNLGWAIERSAGSGIRVLVEAITIPGYYMGTLSAACDLQDSFAGRFDLLFDSYHAAVLGLDGADWLAANAHRLGHVHIADHPGRHEPGTGVIDFSGLRAALARAGYAGAIGFEYIPGTTTADSLGFLPGWTRLPASPSTGVPA